MKRLRPIMIVGTGSDVGKSVLNAGICRILKQDGYQPAPFKGQNMSNNSYATPDGLELGRAQAVQAEACGIMPDSDMNPVLLKPNSDQTSQLVLNGKPHGNQSAFSYFKQNNRQELFQKVVEAFVRLNEKYSPIVIEGAGSISELNLKEKDITNMKVALATNAATFLVADIDRGGVFGSIYGTIQLLAPEERKLIKGIIINKFRGDIRLFEDGKKILEKLTGIPVVGVVPFFRDVHIEEEDAVVLVNKNHRSSNGLINVAVVLFSRMSNFTDFNPLERDPRLHLYYTDDPEQINAADVIILPGTKNTISDLQEIRKKGLVKPILQAFNSGKKVIGICGGYQMLGQEIHDPYAIEGEIRSVPGLGILPVKTTMSKEKRSVQVKFRFREKKADCNGYEIHMGQTVPVNGVENPLNRLSSGGNEGCILNDNSWGTYIHGIFENPCVIDELAFGYGPLMGQSKSYNDFKEEQFDKLAEILRGSLDMDYIISVMKDEA